MLATKWTVAVTFWRVRVRESYSCMRSRLSWWTSMLPPGWRSAMSAGWCRDTAVLHMATFCGRNVDPVTARAPACVVVWRVGARMAASVPHQSPDPHHLFRRAAGNAIRSGRWSWWRINIATTERHKQSRCNCSSVYHVTNQSMLFGKFMFTSRSCPSPLFTLGFYNRAEWVLCLNYNFLCQQWEGGLGLGWGVFFKPHQKQGNNSVCYAYLPASYLCSSAIATMYRAARRQ